jgi:hypothetical protein
MSTYYRALDNTTILDANDKLGLSLDWDSFPAVLESSWLEMEAYAMRYHPRRRVGTMIFMAYGGDWPYTAAGLCIELSYCLRREVDGWSRWLVLQPEDNRLMVPIAKGAPLGHFQVEYWEDVDERVGGSTPSAAPRLRSPPSTP